MFRRKTITNVLTTQERFNEASARTGAALSIFAAAADDLETAALEQNAISADLSGEAEFHRSQANDLDALSEQVWEASENNFEAAARIRNLFAA
jgi:hypothetical protein